MTSPLYNVFFLLLLQIFTKREEPKCKSRAKKEHTSSSQTGLSSSSKNPTVPRKEGVNRLTKASISWRVQVKPPSRTIISRSSSKPQIDWKTCRAASESSSEDPANRRRVETLVLCSEFLRLKKCHSEVERRGFLKETVPPTERSKD